MELQNAKREPNRIAILGGILLAMLLAALDQTIVSTAMPKIANELNGLSHLTWVFTSYMLASAITIPIYGKLSDIFGRRGLYMLGIVIFLIGSALAGLASSMLWLIIFRGLQGIGGGAIMVNSFALIADVFPPRERAKYQGLIGGVFGLASIMGPLLGGFITDNFSWRWIFYINIPLGIVAIAVLAFVLPKIPTHREGRSIDYPGAVFLTSTLVPFLLALVWGGSQYAWNSGQIIGLFALTVVSLILFIFTESRSKDPILTLSLFKNRVFSISVLATFLTAMGMFGAIIYIPLFAQGVIGISATSSGLIMTPLMVALILASVISGQIISRTGRYKKLALLGMVVIVLAMLWFSTINVDATKFLLSARMIALGLGLGITMPIFTLAVQNAFSRDKLGEVTAATTLSRSIGGAVGTAIFGGVMNSQLQGHLPTIGNDAFLLTMRTVSPNAPAMTINNNSVQAILNPTNQAHIKAGFAQAPQELQYSLTHSFEHFVEVIKVAFTQSVDHVYLVSTALMAVALIAVIFLPEIRIQKSTRPVMEEIGIELEEELVQGDSTYQRV